MAQDHAHTRLRRHGRKLLPATYAERSLLVASVHVVLCSAQDFEESARASARRAARSPWLPDALHLSQHSIQVDRVEVLPIEVLSRWTCGTRRTGRAGITRNALFGCDADAPLVVEAVCERKPVRLPSRCAMQ